MIASSAEASTTSALRYRAKGLRSIERVIPNRLSLSSTSSRLAGMPPSFDAARVMRGASAAGETDVKKSLSLRQKACYRIRPTKSFQLSRLLPIQTCNPPCWRLKTTIFQPTDDQETHVPGGI
jgi:hypothetical protein